MNSLQKAQSGYTRRKGLVGIVSRQIFLIVVTYLSLCSSAYAGSTASRSLRFEVRVDLITIHHFHDEHGNYVFTQLIFSDWCESYDRFHVREWRLVKNRLLQMPRRKGRGYVARVMCGDLAITVFAPMLREYGHQRHLWGIDPERVNRQFLPEDQRIPLRQSLFLSVEE